MTDEQLNKILDKIPADKVYQDLLQPGLKTTGQILSDALDLGNLILLPFKLVNERSKIFLRNNLLRYEEKLNKINEVNRCKVDPQIGLPIIDKLTLLNQNELSELFINLLTKASNSTTQNLVHPSFLNILNNLSQDEAILLFALRNEVQIPSIDIVVSKTIYPYKRPEHFDVRGAKSREQLQERIDFDSTTNFVELDAAYNLTGLENDVKLYFPENIDVYIENLLQLGIIRFIKDKYPGAFEEKYKRLIESDYQKQSTEIKEVSKELTTETVIARPEVKRGYIEFTELGKTFLKAVASDIKDLKRA